MLCKIFVFLFLFLAKFETIFGQNESISCTYYMIDTQYSCEIRIINPNGLNNFQAISGTHLPNMTDSDVRRIIEGFEGSSSSNVPSIICATFKNVDYIDLNNIGIRKIGSDSFSGCTVLRELNLYNNKISEINEESFMENHQLQYLWLDENQLENLPENIFRSLKNLTSLSINRNRISTNGLISEWFESLENLQVLLLDSNQIEELPDGVFSPLRNLNYLSIYNNRLKVINSNSFSIHPNLIGVYFHNNQIDGVDEKFIDNTGVTTLFMQNNICVDSYIIDTSVNRDSMRAMLKNCFENFQNIIEETTTTEITTTSIIPPSCEAGLIEERVCKLEDASQLHGSTIDSHSRQIDELLDENQQLKDKIQGLETQVEDQNRKIHEQFEMFLAAMEYLENMVYDCINNHCG